MCIIFFFSSLSQKCADALIQEAMMHRFLVFTNQEPLTWQDQIHFTEIMGEGSAFPDATSANRAFHPKVPDNRLGYFSNNPDEGLMYQGTEGWHVDGNTVGKYISQWARKLEKVQAKKLVK